MENLTVGTISLKRAIKYLADDLIPASQNVVIEMVKSLPKGTEYCIRQYQKLDSDYVAESLSLHLKSDGHKGNWKYEIAE